jgi:hypothetical protein
MEGNVTMTAIPTLTEADLSAGKQIIDSASRTRPASRGFARYLLAICAGVATTLAFQSYGEATKQIIATRAPELGWSPEAKQTIASWVQQLGWTKPAAGPENAAARPSVPETPQAATVAQTTVDRVAPKGPVPFLDPQQVQQIAVDLAALRQTVEQVAASQTRMAAEINNLLLTDIEMFLKIPAPAPQPPAALPGKPTPVPPPSPAPNRRTDLTHNHSLADSLRD